MIVSSNQNGRFAPQLICDACEQAITDAGMAAAGMLFRCFPLALTVVLLGCSPEIGDHYRDVADYSAAKSRFSSIAVHHFPESAPDGSKMYGYFVPMQGGDGLQLAVTYGQSEFDSLLAETESQGYRSAIGIDMDDPKTILKGVTSPRISLGAGKPEAPTPRDRIFTIQDGPKIDRGLIFRTDKRTVVYWVYRDE